MLQGEENPIGKFCLNPGFSEQCLSGGNSYAGTVYGSKCLYCGPTILKTADCQAEIRCFINRL